MLFTDTISNWTDWGHVFQSITAFKGIADEILRREELPQCELRNLIPGTNAVFRAGDYVLKIYAPKESGMDQTLDRETEIFTMEFADKLGIPTPAVVAKGSIEDKYNFAYIVMKYIGGTELSEYLDSASADEQYAIGRKLRHVIDKMNVPCKPFNNINVLSDPERCERWECYPAGLRAERREYIESAHWSDFVFVHGDLCIGNVLVTDEPVIIDFADSVLAPKCYEYVPLFFEFNKYKPFMAGCFDANDSDELKIDIFRGLLIHDFGGDIAKSTFGDPLQFTSLDLLRKKVFALVEETFSN